MKKAILTGLMLLLISVSMVAQQTFVDCNTVSTQTVSSSSISGLYESEGILIVSGSNVNSGTSTDLKAGNKIELQGESNDPIIVEGNLVAEIDDIQIDCIYPPTIEESSSISESFDITNNDPNYSLFIALNRPIQMNCSFTPCLHDVEVSHFLVGPLQTLVTGYHPNESCCISNYELCSTNECFDYTINPQMESYYDPSVTVIIANEPFITPCLMIAHSNLPSDERSRRYLLNPTPSSWTVVVNDNSFINSYSLGPFEQRGLPYYSTDGCKSISQTIVSMTLN